jgi:hypothetical protein
MAARSSPSARRNSFLVAAPSPAAGSSDPLPASLRRIGGDQLTVRSAQTPSDLVWKEDLAFVAAGSGGVVVANMDRLVPHRLYWLPRRARTRRRSLVVAGVAASGLAKLRRSGAGDTLGGYGGVAGTGADPSRSWARAIVATRT